MSQFLKGEVHHARSLTAENSFKYPVLNVYFDVTRTAELQNLFSNKFLNVLSFNPKNYLSGDRGDLPAQIKEFVLEKFSYRAEQVFLQTIPKMFGYVFNPVSFWYFRRNGVLDAVLCEVNNTFGEKHFYWLEQNGSDLNGQWLESKKEFHVSPFFDVAGSYRFKFSLTPDFIDARIHLLGPDGALRLVTSVRGSLVPGDSMSLPQIVFRYGWMTPLVVLRIHYQAVKLYFKKVRFYRKPEPPEAVSTRGTKATGT